MFTVGANMVPSYEPATDNDRSLRIWTATQQPRNSRISSNTALVRNACVNSPGTIRKTLSAPGLRKCEYPPMANGTAKKRSSHPPTLGKCAHNKITATTGIKFARLAKSGTCSGVRMDPSLARSSRCQKTITACTSTMAVAHRYNFLIASASAAAEE